MTVNIRRPSRRLSPEDAVQVWLRHWNGEFQNRIASDYDVNPGRVNDVLKGRLHPDTRVVAAYVNILGLA
ncbi:hypothetical protein MBTS_18370 [Methylobacterium bullatum]|nr:hypothetical protein [Methylobacterium bullatum]